MSVERTRVGEYAASPALPVGRVLSTNSSWRTVNAKGLSATGGCGDGIETVDRVVVGDAAAASVFAVVDVHPVAASAPATTTAAVASTR